MIILHLGTHSQHDTMFITGYEIHQQGVD